ncbi:type VI secretion protein [Streptomyces sp. H27-C3]|uniref:type IV secretory system conjugative DNA transfer family protein n=1 Tax=Streptomyces sp. H27-C3 TaxID=3046305 RepID=UPI0024BA7C21|nr:type VI secretion protein [Streptomyces sp. H27-C3]MDJ0467076.1 type VI secretion protein [Streptomyces sp. H27-C3]
MARGDSPVTGHGQGGGTSERGIPDGLLVGLLAFLFGLTILAWLATGLSGLFAHGAWPDGVTFTRTPLALRHLLGGPQDLPAAWPDTPADQLSGYGLFWGLLIGELMVLIVLTIFALGTLARWRAVRGAAGRGKTGPAARGAGAAGAGRGDGEVPGADADGGAGHGYGYAAGGLPSARPGPGPGPNATVGGQHAPVPYFPAGGAGPGGSAGTGPILSDGAGVGSANPQGAGAEPYFPHAADAGLPGGDAANPGAGAPVAGTNAPAADASAGAAPGPGGPQGPGPTPHLPGAAFGAPPGTIPGGGTAPPTGPHASPSPYPGATDAWGNPAVPAPRTPRVLYGGPQTRRPTTVQAVLDAEGPVLVVTSDPSVWAETKDARAKLGPVLVYDPGHLCDTPARLHWSPTAGCEKADVAAARAVALLAPVRPQARLDAAMADTAETLLSSWLHAAAVDGRPFRQVHRWAQGHSAHEAVRILRTHTKASSGAAGLLESALTAHPERREIAQELTARALAALSSIHIREACTPNRTDSLTLESFADEGGTLYVVGEAIEDPRSRPGAMPLLTALAADVVEHGRRMAARSSDGRLDPPMTLVLDDVAAVAPLPRLPELLSNGRDQGLPILVLLRSPEQGRARWPDHTLTD